MHLTGSVPQPVYDTQIAGDDDPADWCIIGTNLASAYLTTGKSLINLTVYQPGEHQPGQLKYAADDVIYLAEIYPQMVAYLNKAARIGVESELNSLTDESVYLPDPAMIWRRLKFQAAGRI